MSNPGPDLKGAALEEQRFHMLRSIAEELSGEVTFPTSFDIVVRLRKALQNPEQTLDHIAKLLSNEPLIPVRLLHMANTVIYNRGREVKDLKEAINRLGLNNVRTQAMAIAMNQLLRSKEMIVFGDLPQRVWDHSFHAACAAFVISQRKTRINPDEALLAGMVHDLGAFYLLYRFTRYEDLLARPMSVKYLLARWHESIGHSLLMALGMPDEITESVRDHESLRPVPAQPHDLADVIYVSNLLAEGMADWLRLEDYTEASKAMVEQAYDIYQDCLEEISEVESEMRSALA